MAELADLGSTQTDPVFVDGQRHCIRMICNSRAMRMQMELSHRKLTTRLFFCSMSAILTAISRKGFATGLQGASYRAAELPWSVSLA
jgi:hypothetical protein